MFKNILMPTDGSEHSERAIERGIELARLCGAKVTGIHVLPNYRLVMSMDEEMLQDPDALAKAEDSAYDHATAFLGFVKKAAKACGVPCESVIAINDHPYDAIVNTANEHACDLIVMTSRFRRGLASLLMQNESDHVLHRASIPVLTFRALMSADHPDKTPPVWRGLFGKKAGDDKRSVRV